MSNEQELLAELSRQYSGDGQGYLLAELMLILKGDIKEDITEDHVHAVEVERCYRLMSKSNTYNGTVICP